MLARKTDRCTWWQGRYHFLEKPRNLSKSLRHLMCLDLRFEFLRMNSITKYPYMLKLVCWPHTTHHHPPIYFYLAVNKLRMVSSENVRPTSCILNFRNPNLKTGNCIWDQNKSYLKKSYLETIIIIIQLYMTVYSIQYTVYTV